MMMSEEDGFRAMAEAGVDRALRRNLPNFRSETARLLREMERQMKSPPVHRDLPCVFSQLRWAEGLEDNSVNLINSMATVRDYCRHGAAHFAAKEPALAETLRGKAAWSDATRAEVVEIAAGARILRGVCMKMLAEAEEGHIVCMAAAEYLAHMAEDTPYEWDPNSIPVYMYDAVVDQLDAAVAAGTRDPDVVRFMEVFAQERAGNLRRGAAEFGGEDAVKLMEHATTVEALCADTETFLQKIVSSPYFERARLFSIHREAAGGAQTPIDEDDTMFLLLI
ncbi:hypothetical protein ACQ4PT_019438 [Festuca glaucescens]